jgi:hypothetical protein
MPTIVPTDVLHSACFAELGSAVLDYAAWRMYVLLKRFIAFSIRDVCAGIVVPCVAQIGVHAAGDIVQGTGDAFRSQ